LQRFFESGNKAGIQGQQAAKIRLILARLDAAQNPKDMNLPGLRLHQLSGNYRAFHAVDVSGNWRIIFRFELNEVQDADYLDYH